MKRIIIDSNVLALLVVGLTRKTFIDTHKALKDYPSQSFDWLVEILGSYDEWTVTPGILATERSAAKSPDVTLSGAQRSVRVFACGQQATP
jgi:hypothetical protein